MKNYIRLLLIASLLALFFPGADAQGWHRRYPFQGAVWAVSVLDDGYQIAFQQGASLMVGCTDLAGNMLKTVDFGAFPTDFGLIPGPEKGVIKATILPPDNQQIRRIHLEKLDSTGQLRWQATLGDTVSAYELRLAVDTDGSAYLSTMYRYPEYLNWWGQNQKVDIQKIDSSGTVLWRAVPPSWVTPIVNGWPLKTVGEISMLNNGRLAVWATTTFNYSSQQNGWVLDGGIGQLLFPFGTSDCGGSSASQGAFKAIRAAGTEGKIYLFRKSNCSTVGGGHQGGFFWGGMTQLDAQGQVLSSVDFPQVSWDIQTIWKPYPILDTETANGEVISIVQDSSDHFYLWRGSVDLQDTIWQRPIFSSSAWIWTSSSNKPRPGRIFHATPDGGAILGIAPNDSTISLTKIDFWGNIGSDSTMSWQAPEAACQILLSPNPASETSGFALPQTEGYTCEVDVFAGNGSAFYRHNLMATNKHEGDNWFDLDLQGLPSGLWFLRVVGRSGQVWVGKLTKF